MMEAINKTVNKATAKRMELSNSYHEFSSLRDDERGEGAISVVFFFNLYKKVGRKLLSVKIQQT
jgi:hypothetical protein